MFDLTLYIIFIFYLELVILLLRFVIVQQYISVGKSQFFPILQQHPLHNVKPPPYPDSKNYVITQKVKKKHLVQHQKTLQKKKTENAMNVEKMMVMLAIILVAIIAIDGSIKDARHSQTKINILSVIYVNLRKVV